MADRVTVKLNHSQMFIRDLDKLIEAVKDVEALYECSHPSAIKKAEVSLRRRRRKFIVTYGVRYDYNPLTPTE